MLAGVVCLPAALMGWNSLLPGLKMNPSDLKSQIDRATRDYASSKLTLPYISRDTKTAFKALSEQDQAAAVKEAGESIKSLVMSKPFMDSYDAYLKSSRDAVNHGIKVTDQEQAVKAAASNPSKYLDDATKQAAIQMAQMFMILPAESLKEGFASDMEGWASGAKSATGKERLKAQNLLARAKALQPLMTSDPEKFKRGYAVLKSIDMGGPDTEEALIAGQDKSKQEMQQKNWNENNLRVVLKRKLNDFITEAAMVDFAAQTVQRGSHLKFVNPAYERKGDIWKACFRAGKAPTAAALEFARAWTREL